MWRAVRSVYTEEYMTYIVVKSVVLLLGRIHDIFCGDGCRVAVRKMTCILCVEEFCVAVRKIIWHVLW